MKQTLHIYSFLHIFEINKFTKTRQNRPFLCLQKEKKHYIIDRQCRSTKLTSARLIAYRLTTSWQGSLWYPMLLATSIKFSMLFLSFPHYMPKKDTMQLVQRADQYPLNNDWLNSEHIQKKYEQSYKHIKFVCSLRKQPHELWILHTNNKKEWTKAQFICRVGNEYIFYIFRMQCFSN